MEEEKTEFTITISRYFDNSRITINKNANSNKEAQELAFKDQSVLEFIAGYDGLYSVKIINTEVMAKLKLVFITKAQLN